jgi:hypothetical protein
MDPMDITDDSFKRKRKLKDFLDDLYDMEPTDCSGVGIIQPHQNDIRSKVKLMIHHQFSGVELVTPVYAGNFVTCYLSHDQGVDAGSTTQANFSIDLTQSESIGVLMYKLQRKNTNQPNEEVVSNEDEATYTQLVMIWKINSSKEFCIASHLIEHDKSRIWDRENLIKLADCYRVFNIQHSLIECTWLIKDNIVLMTKVNTTREEECYKLEMTLSETSIKDDTQRPQYVGLDR